MLLQIALATYRIVSCDLNDAYWCVWEVLSTLHEVGWAGLGPSYHTMTGNNPTYILIIMTDSVQNDSTHDYECMGGWFLAHYNRMVS